MPESSEISVSNALKVIAHSPEATASVVPKNLSGDANPSKPQRSWTNRIRDAGELVKEWYVKSLQFDKIQPIYEPLAPEEQERFEEVAKQIKWTERYTPSQLETIVASLEQNQHLIDRALRNKEHFTKAIDLISTVNLLGSGYQEGMPSSYAERLSAFSTGFARRNLRQLCALLPTMNQDAPLDGDQYMSRAVTISLLGIDTAEVEVKSYLVDFYLANFRQLLGARSYGIDKRKFIREIFQLGNKEQKDHAKAMLADFADTKNPEMTWMIGEIHVLTLEKFGIDATKYLESIRNSCEEDRYLEVLSGNINRIIELESQHPGITKWLNDDRGIVNFKRYPFHLLAHQLLTRDDTSHPYGVVLYPNYDWNGAFEENNPALEFLTQDLVNSGYFLRVAEADTPLNFVGRLNDLRKKYGKISFAIIGGHGQPDSIQLGRDSSKGFINLADILRKGSSALNLAFEENPTIILVSCSTGVEQGIGQTISGLGAQVIAPKTPTNIENISFQERDGKLEFNVRYHEEGSQVKYQAGRKAGSN